MENARPSKLLPWIAATKLIKAALLLTVAFGFHRFRGGHAGNVFEEYVRAIRVDPHNRIAHAVLTRLTGLSDRRLHELGIATFLYGALFGTEGTGLLLRKRWAEYLTIVSGTDLNNASALSPSEEGADHTRSSAVFLTAAH